MATDNDILTAAQNWVWGQRHSSYCVEAAKRLNVGSPDAVAHWFVNANRDKQRFINYLRKSDDTNAVEYTKPPYLYDADRALAQAVLNRTRVQAALDKTTTDIAYVNGDGDS